MIKIEERAYEQSTYVFVVTLTDEEGDAVVPASLKWTLTTKDELVVNDREQVVHSGLSTENKIVLSGDDLQILPSEEKLRSVDRRFIVEATYDSTLGSGLPVTGVAAFKVTNFVYIK